MLIIWRAGKMVVFFSPFKGTYIKNNKHFNGVLDTINFPSSLKNYELLFHIRKNLNYFIYAGNNKYLVPQRKQKLLKQSKCPLTEK